MIKQEISPEELDVVWPKYGLASSPYNTSPMRLIGTLPIHQVFSGRKKEVKRLRTIISSSESSRNVLYGDPGVGKTTLGNYVRWLMCLQKEDSKYLTTTAEIKVQPGWNAKSFLHATLSHIYNSSKIFGWEKKHKIKLKTLKEIEPYVIISKNRSFQASAAGFGGGYSNSPSSPSNVSVIVYEQLLTNFMNELFEQGFNFIIQYNNLENIEPEEISDLLRSIRDYLQIPGLHSLFLGPAIIVSALEKYKQVSSVFSRPLNLDLLSPDEVVEILKKRCEYLSTKEDYLPPYDEESVKQLYSQLRNIRFTFKVLEDATLATEEYAPCEISTNHIRAVHEEEQKKVLDTLTPNQAKIITALLTGEKMSFSELSKKTGVGSTNLSKPVEELRLLGHVVVEKGEKDKRKKYAKISDSSYLRLYFGRKEHSKETQERLNF